jgi:hypothetical protein
MYTSSGSGLAPVNYPPSGLPYIFHVLNKGEISQGIDYYR